MKLISILRLDFLTEKTKAFAVDSRILWKKGKSLFEVFDSKILDRFDQLNLPQTLIDINAIKPLKF